MTAAAVVLDSDTLSELSRGHPSVVTRARAYLVAHGRLTVTAVTVFERLRGYRAAIRAGKPYEAHLRSFEALASSSIVLPFDVAAADCAAEIWASTAGKRRHRLGDILIAAIAISRGLPLVTRNRRDFEPIARLGVGELALVDWTR